jgi:putative lipoprotein
VKKYLLVLFILSLALSACASGSNSPALVGTTWKLTAYGPVASPNPAVEGSDASVVFNSDGTVTGNGGCNGFGGDYELKEDQLTFGPLVSTLMACEDPRMDQESAVTQVLFETASYKIDGNTLTITKGDTALVFEAVTAQ